MNIIYNRLTKCWGALLPMDIFYFYIIKGAFHFVCGIRCETKLFLERTSLIR